jgi:hypothetical protein
MTSETLAGRDQLDVTEFDDPEPVLAALRAANVDSVGGLVWHFQLDGDSSPTLAVGVRGEIGALVWYEAGDELVPAAGTNGDWVEYWTWFGHDAPMPPRSEVPVELVYAALAELVRTRERPKIVDWTS